MTLEAATYAVEWFSVEGRERFEGDETTVDSTIATRCTTPVDPADPADEFPGGRRFHFQDPSGNELGVWAEA